MRKFKLLSGSHGVPGGKIYHAGDVISSVDDLTVKFVNKFVEVEESTPAAKPVPLATRQNNQDRTAVEPPPPPPPVVEEAPKEVPKREASEAVAKVLTVPDRPKPTPKAKPKAKSKPKAKPKPKVEAEPRRRDVTKNFQAAVDEDFRVVKVGRKYFVYDIDEPDKPINEAGLTSKADVTKAIQGFLEG